MIRLVLGGERSGKSDFALQGLLQGPGPHCLVVTGRAMDLDFRQRIRKHQESRPQDLPVYEADANLAQVLRDLGGERDAPGGALRAQEMGAERQAPVGASAEVAKRQAPVGALLVDSLDFWLFHVLNANNDPDEATQELLDALTKAACDISLVSCEIGLGPSPATPETRAFVRSLGALNQAVAQVSHEVCLVAAGCPLYLKRS